MFKNMKIAVTADQPLNEIVVELERLGIDCWNESFNDPVRVIYVSEISNTAFGAYKSSKDMDSTFGCYITTLAELKEM